MNEFDKIPEENQPEAERNALPKEEAPASEAPVSNAPEAGAAENPTVETPASGSYSFRREQLTDATTQFGGNWQRSADGGNAGSAQNGEYEVSFDSASGKYTFTDHSAPAEVPKSSRPSKKRSWLALGLCATVLVSALLGAGGGALTAYQLMKDDLSDESGNLHSHIQQNTVVQVSNSSVDYGAIAKAAAKCYDSVVVVETYLSESYAEAGEASGAGSGVIWTADGYIVTCNHVIDGANIIRVILTDGTAYYADVVGTDAQTDLAVLKIQAGELLPITARGTELVLGETTIAIGNPLGVLANTLSEGILSSLTRELTIEGQTMSLLQTTAAVNSGNSGGGLFDINGSLIGIVNAKSVGDSVEGLGYAIPIETVMSVCNQLIEQGFVSGRPQLGITVVSVTQANSASVFSEEGYPELEEYATKTSRDPWGRTYSQLVPGTYIYDTSLVVGYADGSDSLKFGDLLLYVGNTEINSTTDVKAALTGYSAGDTIQLTVLRGQSQTIIINLILGQLGSN